MSPNTSTAQSPATAVSPLAAERENTALIVTGAQSDACIRSTIHGGFARGDNVTLVSDAHTTEDLSAWGAPSPGKVVSHRNLYWGFESGPGRQARVQESAEVAFEQHARIPDMMSS